MAWYVRDFYYGVYPQMLAVHMTYPLQHFDIAEATEEMGSARHLWLSLWMHGVCLWVIAFV